VEEYEARKKACTQEEVAKLTASPEFKTWSANATAYSNGLSNGVKHCLVLAYVVVVTSILLAKSSGVTHMFNSIPVSRDEGAERPRLWFPNAMYSVTPSPQSTEHIASLLSSLQKSQAKEKETAKDLSAQIALSSSLQKTVAELENLKAALEAKVKALEDENAELAGQVGKASSEAAALRAEVGRLRAGNDPEQPRARGAKFLDQKLEEAKMQLKMRTHKAPSAPEAVTPEPLALTSWWVTVMSAAYLLLGFIQHARASSRQQSIIELLEKESKTGEAPSSVKPTGAPREQPASAAPAQEQATVGRKEPNVESDKVENNEAAPATGTAIPMTVSESKLPAAPAQNKQAPQEKQKEAPKKKQNGGGFFSRIPGNRQASSSSSSATTSNK